MEFKKKSLLQLNKFLLKPILPSYEDFFDIANEVSNVLENEKSDYRFSDENGNCGSLLDFQQNDLPTIIVPDFHARPFFLRNILNFILPQNFIQSKNSIKKISVFSALKKNLIRIIFVGDILHSEKNTKLRWLCIQEEFNKQNFTGTATKSEMSDGFSLWCSLMILKIYFPQNVHILKGNHENILNATFNGDFSFRKFCDEGNMTKIFVQNYYGDDILHLIHYTESLLPLICVGKNFVVSHAEPFESFTKNELINAKNRNGIIEKLTWTNNDEAQEGSVEDIIKNLCEDYELFDDFTYFAGHRPVKDNFNLRQNNKLVQIHNPSKQNVVLSFKDKKFNPQTDFFGVENE